MSDNIDLIQVRRDAITFLQDVMKDTGQDPRDRSKAAADLLKLVDDAISADTGLARDLSDDQLAEIILASRNAPPTPPPAPQPSALEAAPFYSPDDVPRGTSLAQRLAGIADVTLDPICQ